MNNHIIYWKTPRDGLHYEKDTFLLNYNSIRKHYCQHYKYSGGILSLYLKKQIN